MIPLPLQKIRPIGKGAVIEAQYQGVATTLARVMVMHIASI